MPKATKTTSNVANVATPIEPAKVDNNRKVVTSSLVGLAFTIVFVGGAWRAETPADAKNLLLTIVRLTSMQSAYKRNCIPPHADFALIQPLMGTAQNSRNPLTVEVTKQGITRRETIIPAQYVQSPISRADLASGRASFVD